MEINIADLLRNAPKGIMLYSRAMGEVVFEEVIGDQIHCHSTNSKGYSHEIYHEDGRLHYKLGEVILFPKKDVSWEDWTVLLNVGHVVKAKDVNNDVYVIKITYISGNFIGGVNKSGRTFNFSRFHVVGWASKEEIAEFNKPEFKPYDKVIVRKDDLSVWCCNFYSYYDTKNSPGCPHYTVSGGPFLYCVPFNEQTKHLIGTKDPYQS